MQAPKPSSTAIDTPTDMGLKVFDYETEDNRKYKISINEMPSKMEIEIIDLQDMIGGKYKNELSLADLKKFHKIFRMYDSIEEAIGVITAKIEKREVDVKLAAMQCFLEINFLDQSIISDAARIPLNREEIDMKQTISLLCQQIGLLQAQVKELMIYKEQFIELKAKLDGNNKSFFKPAVKKATFSFSTENSLDLGPIVKNKEEASFLMETIKAKVNKVPKNSNLLFSTNNENDDDSAQTFHEKCDDVKNTLILIQATNGRRFGGFTTQTWNDNNGSFKEDQKAFLFSLDNMEAYHKNNRDSYGIY